MAKTDKNAEKTPAEAPVPEPVAEVAAAPVVALPEPSGGSLLERNARRTQRKN